MARTGSRTSRYSRTIASGSIEIAHMPSLSSVSLKPIGSRPKIADPRSCWAISQTITRFPRAAAASPRA